MGNDLKKTVGQRLQMLRLDRNLTQEQMGEKLNLSTSAYCKIEYGETDLTLTRLSKIATVLNMTIVDLFCKIEGEDDPRKEQSLMHTDSYNDLRDLMKANSRMIDMLIKRIDSMEKEMGR